MSRRAESPPDSIFAVVRSQTAFEETVDRLATAIKLGLLAPGAQLPPNASSAPSSASPVRPCAKR